MRPRVTAVVVVQGDATLLARTAAGLAAQTRAPDAVVTVDAGSASGVAETLARVPADGRVIARSESYGEAVAAGIRPLAPPVSADEWVWLLRDDTPPDERALESLLAAVEVAPSVALAGPKVVDPDDPARLRSYGISLSVVGRTVPLLDSELDQGQYDTETEVLGVAATGTLVRRTVWHELGGFDPGLPAADAGLDLSVRARLAGHRVMRVPDARVASGRHAEDFGRRRAATPRMRRRLVREAQLHRRFVYAPAALLPVHWLSLVPLAVLRSLVHLLAKHPSSVAGEFAAAFRAAFADSGVPRARTRLASARRAGWSAIAPLRVPPAELRRRRAAAEERAAEGRAEAVPLVRAEFFAGGGVWVVVIAALVGLGMLWRLLGAHALEGGAALPLSSGLGRLWANALGTDRVPSTAASGPADPFGAVLAVLGTASFPAPSFAIVLLWLLALPLAALGAWWCATRFSTRAWPPAVAALVWALAPPLVTALADGRVPAVIAHLALPWLVLAAIEGRRSWSAAATASLLFAVVAACSPVTIPALLIAWLGWTAVSPRAAARLVGIPIPAVALFLPLALARFAQGRPFELFADPGVALRFVPPEGPALALTEPRADAAGWAVIAQALGLGAPAGGIVVAVLLAPLAALALLALFLPGSRRAVPPMVLALLGLVSAVVAVHVAPVTSGTSAIALWPGPALGIYLIGLLSAAVLGLRALGRTAVPAGLALVVAVAVLAAPSVITGATGGAAIRSGDGQTLPALVAARGIDHPEQQTLLLTAFDDGTLGARVVRGPGETLDERSTLVETAAPDAADRALARLAGNLASRSGLDPRPALDRFGIRFVLLDAAAGDATPAALAVRTRAAEGLDRLASLTPVGSTSQGELWQFSASRPAAVAPEAPSPLHGTLLVILAIVIGSALLLAIPTGRRRPVQTEADPLEDPENDFGEDDRD